MDWHRRRCPFEWSKCPRRYTCRCRITRHRRIRGMFDHGHCMLLLLFVGESIEPRSEPQALTEPQWTWSILKYHELSNCPLKETTTSSSRADNGLQIFLVPLQTRAFQCFSTEWRYGSQISRGTPHLRAHRRECGFQESPRRATGQSWGQCRRWFPKPEAMA